MSAIRRAYAQCSWGQVHHATAGEGIPCAFFHESPQSWRVFEGVLGNLSGVRGVAFDTPGYGASDPPPHHRFEIPDYAARLLEAIDDLGLESFAVAGVHTGASLALEVARQAGSDRVVGAVLSGVPLLTEAERAQFLSGWSPPMTPDADGSYLGWAWERYQRIWGADSHPDVLHLAVTGLLGVLDRYEWAYNAAFRYDPGPALAALQCPVLFLNASNDLLASHDQKAAKIVAESSINLVEGFQGQLPLRAPRLYATEVSNFLQTTTTEA